MQKDNFARGIAKDWVNELVDDGILPQSYRTQRQRPPYVQLAQNRLGAISDVSSVAVPQPKQWQVDYDAYGAQVPHETVDKMLNDERYQRFRRRVSIEEGGYNDNPATIDRPTNRGIIQNTLDGFRRDYSRYAKGFPENIRDLTPELTDTIYYNAFYQRNRIPQIEHDNVAYTMYDYIVNHSPQEPIKVLQQAINAYSEEQIQVDGVLGSGTIAALNRLTRNPEKARQINDYIVNYRLNEFHDKSKQYQKKFKGLESRIRRSYVTN